MELSTGAQNPGPLMIDLSEDPFSIGERPTPAGTQQRGTSSFTADHGRWLASTQHGRGNDQDGWPVLPTDVLGLIARELGLHEAQAMTRVCRGWLQGVDRTLTQLKPRSLHAARMANRYHLKMHGMSHRVCTAMSAKPPSGAY